MANVSPGPQNAPANTGVEVPTPSTISAHVGGQKVRIDTTALKHLIETLKTKLRIRS